MLFRSDKNSIEDLVGEIFRVATVEECDDREDTFYLYESEPMVSYDLEVLEIKIKGVLSIITFFYCSYPKFFPDQISY